MATSSPKPSPLAPLADTFLGPLFDAFHVDFVPADPQPSWPRWAAATVVAVGTLGLVGVAYSGLVFNRFDGAYATAYWYVLVSCALHLGVIAVVLAGLTNRIRVGGDVPDGTSVRAVRILVVWTSVAVTILCLVASVGG